MSGVAAAAAARRNRWAVSFADLLLLLLGFFILLQASGLRRDTMLSSVRQEFGGHVVREGVALPAIALFVPGEALLTPKGIEQLTAAVRAFPRNEGRIELRSSGFDSARQRFDDWDLAAARLGAIARALRMAGFAQDRLLIRGMDQMDGKRGQGQMIRIAQAPADRP